MIEALQRDLIKEPGFCWLVLNALCTLVWYAWRRYMAWVVRHEMDRYAADYWRDTVKTTLARHKDSIEGIDDRLKTLDRALRSHLSAPRPPDPNQEEAPPPPPQRSKVRARKTKPKTAEASWLDKLTQDDEES